MIRPPHISQVDWDRMPWYAREKAARRAGTAIVVVGEQPDRPKMPKAAKQRRRIRIYRVEPYCWEITNGVSTARTFSAEAAWRLLEHCARAA
ncbi:MAG: hypothetical protein RL134_645 [Actinomycetota bacterium]|jgi:hypothetical protein